MGLPRPPPPMEKPDASVEAVVSVSRDAQETLPREEPGGEGD